MAMPRIDPAAEMAAELADIERIWQSIDVPGHRIELIDGQVVVSPSASVDHSAIVTELIDQLVAVKRRGWARHTNLTVHFPVTHERRIPDLIVASASAPRFGDSELLVSGILLATEVVSPSSRVADREERPRAYADGGIPIFLLVDRLAQPPSVSVFSQPSADGYARMQVATAGQPLRLPEPLGIDLDTARLLG